MLFEPQDRVSLYVAAADAILVYEGDYTYDAKTRRLNLQFSHENFTRQADFTLDLNAAEVTMPFQVFSPERGESRWNRQIMGLSEGLHFIFRAAAWSDEQTSLPEARDQAFQWGKNRAGVWCFQRVDPFH